MSSRRDFLKTLGAAVISSAGAPLLLNGCVGLATIRAQVNENKIKLNKTEIQALAVPNGILLVKAPQLPGAIILRNFSEVGIVAVSSICTHRGCEVRAMPRSLQCPCHGSEYDELGEVLEGPATRPLKRYEVIETPDLLIIKVS